MGRVFASGMPAIVPDVHAEPLFLNRTGGGDALAAAYVETEIGEGDDTRVLWGVGRHSSIVTASMKAVISAVNRAAAAE